MPAFGFDEMLLALATASAAPYLLVAAWERFRPA